MTSENKRPTVAVVGGGLVGALNACFLAKRGFLVDLYEAREDIRKTPNVQGKSINLSLSYRGRKALKAVGLENEIVTKNGIPMKGRMIHSLDEKQTPIPYGKDHEYIVSVSRRRLNEILLSSAENYSNVKLHFQHKLVKVDLTKGEGTFQNESEEVIFVKADLLIGCDGAHSTIRREMAKRPGYNCSQNYIKHCYKEFCIPPKKNESKENGEYTHAMKKNYLHIWPRKQFMLIALPNADLSFTVTLFMSQINFDLLQTEESVQVFFKQYFPDALKFIGEKELSKQYFNNKYSHLVSIKCFPYHVGSKVLIMGDAAHAMVPFYGQGMNAGFEDCLIFDEFLSRCNNDFDLTLPRFSNYRNPDAEAICDLAMYNYEEMRLHVISRSFLLRKKLDNILHCIFRKRWIPLYSMVTFTDMRYHVVVEKRRMQDQILDYLILSLKATAFSTAVIATILYNPILVQYFSDYLPNFSDYFPNL